jgi:PAS domain S-box-containing protein
MQHVCNHMGMISRRPSDDDPEPQPSSQLAVEKIIGKGEMADLVRSYDWSSTPLGAIETWSKELLTIVNLTLCSPSPTRTMWGSEFILIYNDAYRPIPGPRHPAALGKPAKRVYAESWHVVGPLLEKAYATGETLFYEKLVVPLPTENGIQDFYLNYAFNPIFENGKIAGLFGPLHDVTGEVTATRKLQESKARSKRILQSIGDAVIVTDAEARITHMNPVSETLTGWPFEEAEHHLLAEVFRIIDEDKRETVESPIEKVKRLGTIVGLGNHTILLRRDGTEVFIDDSGAPIFEGNGRLSGMVLVFRDISEKRQAENESQRMLLEVQGRYAELEATYNTAAIAMALIDATEFRYIRVNQKLCEILGLRREQVLGSRVSDVAGQVPGLKEALEQVARGESVVGGLLEGELSTSPGVKRYWTMDYAPVFDSVGKVVAIAAASAEITHQKRAEAMLIQSEKLAAVGRLASSIAHEINNPLESVTNLLYLARAAKSLSEVQDYLSLAERELRRAAAITTQTLRFHKQTSRAVKVACKDLIESVLAIQHGRIVNSRIQVEQRHRTQTIVDCYEGEIRQVLNNLVSNAIDSMQSCSGRLILRSRQERAGKGGRKGVVITVADTGLGMAPQTVARTFEPFFTTKGQSGTGLGLWISKEIVGRHKGALTLKSSQKSGASGTVIRVFLPFQAAIQDHD